MDKAIFDDPKKVWFEGPSVLKLKPGEADIHGIKDITERLFSRDLDEVQADWKKVMGQIRGMLEGAYKKVEKEFNLDAVEISLGFNAKGKLVFVAEAGVQATVTVKFRRAKL